MRAPYICQAQSINLFFDAEVDESGSAHTSLRYMFEAHVNAWLMGLKSLYYVRSRSVLKNDSVGRAAIRKAIETGGDCQACQ
jgi:ribonucleoside-diphosphate reductase alpha chain